MTIVEWTPDLDTGIPDIDEQHKQMVHHINDFYEAANAKDKERMAIVLFDLINSTLAHFQYEEALMEQAKYPLLEPHRRVHKNFIDKLMALHEKLQTMETTDDIAVLLIDSLDGWLFRHIRINDKGYTNSVNESGVYQAMHEESLAAAQAAQMQEYGEVAEPTPEPQPAPQAAASSRPAPQAQAVPEPAKPEPKPAVAAPKPESTPAPQPKPAHQPAAKPEPQDDEPKGWASGNWKF